MRKIFARSLIVSVVLVSVGYSITGAHARTQRAELGRQTASRLIAGPRTHEAGPGIRGLSLAQVFETRPAEGPGVAEYLIRMVPRLMYQGTFLLAGLVGIALALVSWRRGRRAAVVTLIASLVLLVTSIAISGVYAFISLDPIREMAFQQAKYDVVRLVNELVRGIVVIALLIAAFIGRKLPTAAPS